jgi:hypothetical protein
MKAFYNPYLRYDYFDDIETQIDYVYDICDTDADACSILNDYTLNSRWINTYLNDGYYPDDSVEYQNVVYMATTLKNIFENVPTLTDNIVVFRFQTADITKHGDEDIIIPTYTSTVAVDTYDEAYDALKYNIPMRGRCCMMIIKVLADSKILPLAGVSPYEDEKEILLAPGVMRILETGNSHGGGGGGSGVKIIYTEYRSF